jgi:glycosyltransferase involved in cell wall biosynthesis
MFSKLSILVPCYNEAAFIPQVIQKILDTSLQYPLAKEIIVVDDASTDNSHEAIQPFLSQNPGSVILLKNERNSGKGASVMKALQHATGDIVVIQDADLEYDPSDYNKLLKPIIEGQADVVFGSRFKGEGPHRVLFYFHTIGNRFLTSLSNLFTQINLTDMETGYKMFRTDILKQVRIKEKRFGFEPEVTAKISRIKGVRIYETGIAYYGRTYKQGKKIKWTDGLKAIWCILKYNLFSRK